MDKELFVTLNAMLDDELANKKTDLAKIGGLWLMRQVLIINLKQSWLCSLS